MHLHWKLNYLRIGTELAEPPVLIVPIAANIVENASNSPTDSSGDNHIVCFNTFRPLSRCLETQQDYLFVLELAIFIAGWRLRRCMNFISR